MDALPNSAPPLLSLAYKCAFLGPPVATKPLYLPSLFPAKTVCRKFYPQLKSNFIQLQAPLISQKLTQSIKLLSQKGRMQRSLETPQTLILSSELYSTLLIYKMADSPSKSDREKLREKKKKMQAFQSFLQKNDEPQSIDLQQSVTNMSDTEQKLENISDSNCCVCKEDLGERKKFCGWCRDAACGEHLRKKRKSKETHKFVRICDNCEDKYLFGKYMKMEMKNQQSISAQEIIVSAKKQEVQELVNGRRTKLKLLYTKQNEILGRKKQHSMKFSLQLGDIKGKEEKLNKKVSALDQLEEQLKKLEQKLPPALQDDFHALQIQNARINKDLVKYDRLCNQAIKAKSKREKQIYDEYSNWQQAQKAKLSKKDDDCHLF